MKALGSRFSFYAGFVVGTFTLYVFLRQVWFERNLSAQHASSLDKLRDQQMVEEEEKIWKKERSALFNLKHPHHTGESEVRLCVQRPMERLCVCVFMNECILHIHLIYFEFIYSLFIAKTWPHILFHVITFAFQSCCPRVLLKSCICPLGGY